jgi:type 1 glutamine amidotransferase
METLGTQFIAHPPIASFRVEVTNAEDPLVRGIEAFDVVDELYLSDVHAELQTVLHTSFEGEATGFVRRNWTKGNHPVLYRRSLGQGQIVYFTLGHCRGHYDMQPLVEYWPEVQKCAWESPQYVEILKRGLAWARDGQA